MYIFLYLCLLLINQLFNIILMYSKRKDNAGLYTADAVIQAMIEVDVEKWDDFLLA